MKTYCDNGACSKELKSLQKKGVVELYMFKYENKNRHVPNSGVPSKATWKDLGNYTWDTIPGTWGEYCASEKYEQIVSIVGLANNRVDILHLDSAFKSQCKVFVTNDKDDIWSKRSDLESLLGIRIFCVAEMSECIQYIESANHGFNADTAEKRGSG